MLVVGVCQVELSLHGNGSLKGKRAVVRRVIDRTRHRFRVSIAEVDANDVLDTAVIGFAVVGNSARLINSRIDRIVGFIDELGEAPVTHHDFEILQY